MIFFQMSTRKVNMTDMKERLAAVGKRYDFIKKLGELCCVLSLFVGSLFPVQQKNIFAAPIELMY